MKEFELEPGEHVVWEARRHWFLFLADLLPYAILAILPFATANVIPFVPPLAPYQKYFDYAEPLERALLGLWFLIVWTSAWGRFTKYFLNAWVLTNQRIVNIKQRAYFNREVSSLFLSRVQDATTEVAGILPSLLNIGNINVQTAGATEKFDMRGIPRPEQMRDLILKYVPSERHSGPDQISASR
ncbi:PH domain-containing protein [Candidatus Kaiserbacteria bacterium]|nr:PH domain-containing protein [Candidatus Kaiserbacteria bacterium]